MTTTGKWSHDEVSGARAARPSLPSSSISSSSIGTYSAGTGSQTSHCIISWNNSAPIGSGSGTAAVAVVGDDLQRDLADRRLVLLGHVALHLIEEEPGRFELAADELGITRHVDQRQHQRRDADVEQRLGDLLIRRRKGLSCMWVAHL